MHPPQSTHPHNPSPKIIMEEGNSNWHQLPLHWVGVPVQVPLLLHVLVVDPVKMYPLLQENPQVCPGKLEQGSRLPCGGSYSCWQCLSVKKRVKKQLFFFSKLATGSFSNAPSSRLEIHRISGELKKCVRTEKTEEKNTSYCRQCS